MNAMTDTARLKGEEVRIREGAPAAGWLIVVTKGQKERSVCDRLQAQGFETYLPLRLLEAAQAKRRGVVAVPYFPRIVFARATLDADRWQSIFSTIGVIRVMCDPHRPRGVSAAFVERLRRREFRGFLKAGLRDPSKPREAFKAPPRGLWVRLSLDEIVKALENEAVDEVRKSLLVSLLDASLPAISADLRKL